MSLRPAAFLDRDGVINADRGYIYQREAFDFLPGVFDAVRELRRLAFVPVIVTNQSGIGRGFYSESDFNRLTEWMKQRFTAEGAPIDAVYFCPHHAVEAGDAYRLACDCRKPAPGMLLAAGRDLNLDLSRSAMFGDRASDLEAAQAAGVRTRFLLATNGTDPTDAAELPPGLCSAAFGNLLDAALSPQLRQLASALPVITAEGT